MNVQSFYQPLRQGFIRLVYLEGTTLIEVPGSLDGAQDLAIRCRLTVCSFNEVKEGHIPYTALSYTWGSEVFGRWIVCDGNIRRVTGNLYNLLLQLTLSEGFRNSEFLPLWIDALCVNQDDLEEKSYQVSIMGEIYRAASYVTVWLGNPVEIAGDALARFWENIVAADPNHKMKGIEFEAGKKFLNSCAWFKRAWTFQEFLLAKEAVIRCGPFAVDWNIFRGRCVEIEPVTRIQEAAETYKAGSIDITDLLALTSERRSTNPRDKIFSLKAVCTQSLPQTSYKSSVRSLFSEVSGIFIEQTQDLRILQILDLPLLRGFPGLVSQANVLPDENFQGHSWIPDWTVAGSQIQPNITSRLVHTSGEDSEFLRRLHPGLSFDARVLGSTLVCKGAVFGQWVPKLETQGEKLHKCSFYSPRIPKCMAYLLVGPLYRRDASRHNKLPPCSHPDMPEDLIFQDAFEIYQKFIEHNRRSCSCPPGLKLSNFDRCQLTLQTNYPDMVTNDDRPVGFRPKGGWLCWLFGGLTAFALHPELDSSGENLEFVLVGKGQTRMANWASEIKVGDAEPCGCEVFCIPTVFKIR